MTPSCMIEIQFMESLVVPNFVIILEILTEIMKAMQLLPYTERKDIPKAVSLVMRIDQTHSTSNGSNKSVTKTLHQAHHCVSQSA